MDDARLWGGRFSVPPARALQDFTHSVAVDRRLYRQDIAGSIAHVRMLGTAGIIPAAEAQAIARTLLTIRRGIEAGEMVFSDADEDIHSAIERRLTEILGPEVGGKLHTGRSRNDQVALDLRLYARAAITDLGRSVIRLQSVLLGLAQQHAGALVPAYTHMQRAQPTSLGHHLLAYVAMLQRDFDRLQDAYDRADVMPLGSGAATGSSLPLRREQVATELDFGALSQNSLDAVSDRDFVVEIQAACALVMVHLSRFAEELVTWSTAEFGFIELSDDYTTGSSLMPQKKNPDVAELVRGRSGRAIGNLVAMLTVLKGLPLSYNRDLQEDKAPFFETVDTTRASLEIFARMLTRARFRLDRMAAAATDPALYATEVADYLVRRGVPFRAAHEVVGRAVRKAAARKVNLAELDLETWQSLDPTFEVGVTELFDGSATLARHELPGAPGPRAVKRALVRATVAVKRNRAWLEANRGAGTAL